MNGNFLTSLQGSPDAVTGDFNVSSNRQITSLHGSPKIIKGALIVYDTAITNLIGSPKEVGKIVLTKNDKLTSLEGIPSVELTPENFQIMNTWMYDFHTPNVSEIEIQWYQEEGFEGYNHYFKDLFKYIINNDIGQLNTVHWPPGFLDENLKRSAGTVKKYKL